eukprot:Rmarinus@m.25743
MSVTLYHYPLSLCSQKVRLCLAEKGVEYTPRVVDIGAALENYEPWYIRLNPRMVVPTLVHGDKVVVDSAKIIEYIDEAFPGPSLVPAPDEEKSEMRRWVEILDKFPFRDLSYSRMPGGAASLSSRMRMLEETKRDLPEFADQCDARKEVLTSLKEVLASPEKVELVRKQAVDLLDSFNNHLQTHTWAAGSAYSLADVMWTVALARMAFLDMAQYWEGGKLPLVDAYYQRCKDRPSYSEAQMLDKKSLGLVVVLARSVLYRVILTAIRLCRRWFPFTRSYLG